MTQTDCRSGRLGIAHLLDPALDQGPGIVRSRSRLRMELDGARPLVGEREPFDRPVVERDVRHGWAVSAYREPVILARDQYLAAREVENGMVRAPVTERQLERLQAGGESEELVPE